MSVTSITELSPPESSDSLSGGKTVTRNLQAVCTKDLVDGPVTIGAHASCPKIGDSYAYGAESVATLVCIGVNIANRQDNNGKRSHVWDVTASYSNSTDTGSIGDPEDPLDDDPVIEFSFNKYQVPAEIDRDGVAVKNGADETFDPPYLLDENRPILTVTRNEMSFNAAVAVEYQDAVNSDSFAGVGPGVAKMIGISAREATRGDIDYWVVTYEIEFRWNGWNPTKLLALGYKYRLSPDGPSRQYLDPVTNQPPSTPLLLQLDGTESPPVDGVRPAFFHEFNFYREKPFGLLALGL